MLGLLPFPPLSPRPLCPFEFSPCDTMSIRRNRPCSSSPRLQVGVPKHLPAASTSLRHHLPASHSIKNGWCARKVEGQVRERGWQRAKAFQDSIAMPFLPLRPAFKTNCRALSKAGLLPLRGGNYTVHALPLFLTCHASSLVVSERELLSNSASLPKLARLAISARDYSLPADGANVTWEANGLFKLQAMRNTSMNLFGGSTNFKVELLKREN